MKKWKAILIRAWKTLIQSAVGAAISAALTAIGSATAIGDVKWWTVASSAGIAFIVALLWNIKASLPEVDYGKEG